MSGLGAPEPVDDCGQCATAIVRISYDGAMTSGRVLEFQLAAAAVRAELARRNIPRRDAVAVLQAGEVGLGRTAAYERIAGLVPFTWTELGRLSEAFGIPVEVLSGTRAPDLTVTGP